MVICDLLAVDNAVMILNFGRFQTADFFCFSDQVRECGFHIISQVPAVGSRVRYQLLLIQLGIIQRLLRRKP